jgi:hypothetical protein
MNDNQPYEVMNVLRTPHGVTVVEVPVGTVFTDKAGQRYEVTNKSIVTRDEVMYVAPVLFQRLRERIRAQPKEPT